LFGRVPIAVRHYQNGQVTEQFTISATVKRQVTAMVATDTIRRDSRFDPGKVEQQTVWLSRDREPVKEMDLLAGQRADGVLREGDLVYPDDVASPVLVERRDLVTVRCLSGGLVVRTVARALDEGSKGDVIRVRNESSRETFTCKVTGPREAVVEARNEEGAVPMAAMQGEK
jgi:flagella basal body P-ring formation protein FlgA